MKHLWIIFLLAGLASCNLFNRQGAVHMNNTFVMINAHLYTEGGLWLQGLREAVKTHDFQQLTTMRTKLEQYIDSCRKDVIDMQDIGGSEEFRKCEIEYLTFEKNLLEKDFKGFERFNAQTDMSEISALYDTVSMDAQPEAEKLKRFKALQEAFSRKNGFKLQQQAGAP